MAKQKNGPLYTNMAKTDITSVDDYIASQPQTMRAILAQVRKAIRDSVPEAEEAISYKLPTYKHKGDAMLHFAGWKQHYSLYPATERVLTAFKAELEPYKIHKATIRFPISQPVPVALIARIAKFRAKEIAERIHSKPKVKTKS
ncbi:MAG: DUF1801 domain-containing protein [Acidobacteriaceae bacterium]